MKQPAVYLMASQPNGTLYVGVTSNLVQRAGQHRTASHRGFAARHGCTMLVWFELHASMAAAIMREKQIKAGSRARRLALIEADNPAWRDLFHQILWPFRLGGLRRLRPDRAQRSDERDYSHRPKLTKLNS